MTQTMPENTELGPIGDTVVFENEHVRVWKLDLGPGETQAWHKHELSYLVIPLTKGNNVMRFADGREKPTEEEPGQALWREPGMEHELENTSDFHYANMLVELKRPAG